MPRARRTKADIGTTPACGLPRLAFSRAWPISLNPWLGRLDRKTLRNQTKWTQGSDILSCLEEYPVELTPVGAQVAAAWQIFAHHVINTEPVLFKSMLCNKFLLLGMRLQRASLHIPLTFNRQSLEPSFGNKLAICDVVTHDDHDQMLTACKCREFPVANRRHYEYKPASFQNVTLPLVGSCR